MAKIDVEMSYAQPSSGMFDDESGYVAPGMTKRERFAMEFMREIVGDPSMRNAEMAANWSVARADALLDALAR